MKTLSRRSLLLGAAATMGLSACGMNNGVADDGSLRVWTNHTAEDEVLLRKVLAEFERGHPDVRVTLLNIANGNDFYTKLKTASVGYALPDVWFVRTFEPAFNASNEWQRPIDDLVVRDRAEVRPDDFWPAEVAQMTYDGKLYCLPYDFSNFAVYYNKAMFADAGVDPPDDDWTWEDLFELGKQFVRNEGGRQTQWGVALPLGDWLMRGVFHAYGGAMFSDDLSECVLDSEENIGVLELFQEQLHNGVAPAPGATPAGVDPFAAGMVAMNINGSWATLQTRATIGDHFDWDVAKLPKGSTGERAISTAGGSWGISTDTKSVDQSWELVKFLASKRSTDTLISKPTRSIPGRKSSAKVWQQIVQSAEEPPSRIEIFLDEMGEDALNLSYPAYWPEFEVIWNNRIQGLLTGSDPADVLARIEADSNAAAARYA